MGVIEVTDELQHIIDREVRQGHAASPAALLEEAVLRLVQDTHGEESEVVRAAHLGIADIEAGRFRTIATSEDADRLDEEVMARVERRLATGE